MLTKRTSKLDQPTRIWTDYQRFNETFFWSATALQWWTFENEHQSRLSQLNNYLLSSYSSVNLIWSLQNLIFETCRSEC